MIKKNKNALILGGQGLLGSQLVYGNYLQGHRVIVQGRSVDAGVQVNLQELNEVQSMLDRFRPEVIVNLIALTNVDICEEYPNEAYKVNVRSLENVIAASKALGLKPYLIHISTDQVYDGIGPHNEEFVNLKNYYAFSKYMAELVAKAEGGVILRTNFFGKSKTVKRKSLTDWLFEELSGCNEIGVFHDVMFSPLSIYTLCDIIALFVKKKLVGVFNLGSNSGFSKADFAYKFAEYVGLPTDKITRVSVNDVEFIKTYRPKDMRMNVSKIEKALGMRMPSLSDEIERVSMEYKNECKFNV